jgi:anti-sigma B factor antagonist
MVLSLATYKHDSGTIVIEIAGRVTFERESAQIELAVMKALHEGARKIVIDLGQVAWIDSTGIGIIAYCFGKAARADAKLCAAGANGGVLEVFRITRIDRVIDFFPDVASACAPSAKAASAT